MFSKRVKQIKKSLHMIKIKQGKKRFETSSSNLVKEISHEGGGLYITYANENVRNIQADLMAESGLRVGSMKTKSGYVLFVDGCDVVIINE